VGSEREKFILPKNRLEHHSRYFKALFSGGFKESKDFTVELDDANAESFKVLVQWMYTKTAVMSKGPLDTDQKMVTRYVNCLSLADRLDLNDLELKVIPELRRILKRNRLALEGAHIRAAFALPDKHRLQDLVVQASLQDYFQIRKPNRFALEIQQMDSYAAAIMRAGVCYFRDVAISGVIKDTVAKQLYTIWGD
jgi:hypothetical protein